MPPPTLLLAPPGFSEHPTTLHWSHSSISLFTSLSTFVVADNIPRPPVGLGFVQGGGGINCTFGLVESDVEDALPLLDMNDEVRRLGGVRGAILYYRAPSIV